MEQLFKKQDALYNGIKKMFSNKQELETLLASCSIKYIHRSEFNKLEGDPNQSADNSILNEYLSRKLKGNIEKLGSLQTYLRQNQTETLQKSNSQEILDVANITSSLPDEYLSLPSVHDISMQQRAIKNLNTELDKKWGEVLRRKVSSNVVTHKRNNKQEDSSRFSPSPVMSKKLT